MKSNLQANSLTNLNSSFFISEPFELNKRRVKELSSNSWLKIKKRELNIFLYSKKGYIKFKLFSKDEYIFIDKKDSLRKISKIKKEQFRLKFFLDKDITNSYIALAKMPIEVTLLRGKKEYATANLYITNSIFIEIKEVL